MKFLRLNGERKSKRLILLIVVCVVVLGVAVFIIVKENSKSSNRKLINNILSTKKHKKEEDNYYEKYAETIEDSVRVYSQSAYYRINSNIYHVQVENTDKYVIRCNDSIIYELDHVVNSNDLLNSAFLVKDLFVIYDSLNHKLLFIDTEGNNVKTIDNVYESYVDGVDIVFSLNDYVPRSGEVYERHSLNQKKISYLGNLEFSDMETLDKLFYFTTPNGCTDYHSRCTLYDKDNLKIEVEDSFNNIYVNNKLIHIDHYSVNEIKLTDDNYVFLNYLSNDIGYNSKALIVDKNGDITTDFDDYIDNDSIRNSFSMNDGIVTYTVNNIFDGIILACSSDNYIKNGHTYDSVVYYEYSYKYIGNGKVALNGTSSKTFRELIKYQTDLDNCEQVLDAWNNGINIYKKNK